LRGWKDYTKPITIEAVTVETLPIDIKAQTLGTVSVNIAASAVTLNVKTAAGEKVDVGVVSAVQLDVNIAASAVTLNVHEAGTANVAVTSSVTLNMNIVGSTVNVPVVNPAGQSLNVGITSSVTLNISITGSTVNVPVTTASGQHVDVDVVASVTLNVNIAASAVTLNVAIQSSAVTLNVDVTNPALTVGQAPPALSFDGTNDYVSLPLVTNAVHTVTLAAWFRSPVSAQFRAAILSIGDASSGYRIIWGYDTADNGLRVLFNYICWIGPVYTLAVNTWYHVAVTIEYETATTVRVKIYVNGNLVHNGVYSNPITPAGYSAVGKELRIPGWFNGVIDEVRVYSRVLSASEITDLYNNPHAGPTQGLILWLPMDEGTGASVADKSGQGNNGTIYGATWVSREGSVPATVNTNIVAQSIGNIGIDIKAQTLGQLNVNIAASAVTLNVNISSVTSGVTFNVAQSGTWTINAVESGTWTINIGAPLDASGNLKTAILSSVQLNVNIAASAVTLNVNISSQSVTLNVAVTGTANVNITSAIVNISSVRLMDSGTIKRVWAQISNGTSTMYTVPTGKKFYIYSVALNVLHYGTGSHLGYLTAYDGTTNYHILYLSGPDSVDNMHDAIGFNVMSIPAGWSVYVGAGAYSTSIACVIGVEVTA
jgi:hypothetical protein